MLLDPVRADSMMTTQKRAFVDSCRHFPGHMTLLPGIYDIIPGAQEPSWRKGPITYRPVQRGTLRSLSAVLPDSNLQAWLCFTDQKVTGLINRSPFSEDVSILWPVHWLIQRSLIHRAAECKNYSLRSYWVRVNRSTFLPLERSFLWHRSTLSTGRIMKVVECRTYSPDVYRDNAVCCFGFSSGSRRFPREAGEILRA